MNDQLIVDFGDDGRVTVSLCLEGGFPGVPASEPYEVVWPLNDAASTDLRWYLEDYLQAPYGVYGERGPAVADRLAGWGEQIFAALFGRGPGRDAYLLARVRDEVGTEVVVRSGSPEVLGLPWELLRDPERTMPLALDLAGVSRSLPEGSQAPFAVSGERLRVLMVICRPGGGSDIGYRMIARPLLERLSLVRGHVDLVVLRPPTLAALRSTLAEAAADGEGFQVVHFDGHGALVDRQRGRSPARGEPPSSDGPGGEGILVFEAPGGGRDEVPAAVFADVLAAADVPLVVLNACESGAVGKRVEAAIATRLMQAGAASVVAMAYRVHAVAAAEFMAELYERIFAGDGITEAVGAGRRRLYEHDKRPSPKGPMPLADWVVPVQYLGGDVRFPHLLARHDREVSLNTALNRLSDSPAAASGAPALEPVGVFVGRDALFYDLEVAARRHRVVVLHGSGGTGKTELAKAFGRWWADTGGVESPDWVIVHSFEPGVASFGLDGLIAAVGLRVIGLDFSRLEPAERRAAVERLLTQRRLLLILDNFETVATMLDPTVATPPLDAAGRYELAEFIAGRAASGKSVVIITSRSREAWLGEVGRIEVGGLNLGEAIEYALQLLAPYPAAVSRLAKPGLAHLVECLDGHPLAMRLVLPHLDTTAPEALVAALAGVGHLPDVDGGNPQTSLASSVAYSFEHLTPAASRLLVVLCLFHGVADATVLSLFSLRMPGTPERFRGTTRTKWEEALDAAAEVGLLTRHGGGLYRVHPALPAFLAARWCDQEPLDHDAQRQAAIAGLLAAYAVLGRWLRSEIDGGDAGAAYIAIGNQRRTLGAFLGLALENRQWKQAEAIFEPLDDYWAAHGWYEEAQGWLARARVALEGPEGTPPALEGSAGNLWLSLTWSNAERDHLRGRPDEADGLYRAILQVLRAQAPSPRQRRRLAITHLLLGTVAQDRGRPDEAEDWYHKALAIELGTGDRPVAALAYNHLGVLAQHRGRFDEAEDWHRKSLAIREETGNRPGMATSYHNLGYVAHDRGRLDDAERWYRKSQAVAADTGDRPSEAASYHHLGMVAQDRGRLEEAEQWYRMSLATSENLRNRRLATATYHQLGMVAHDRGELDEAEDWARKSLAESEALGDRDGVATSGQLLANVVRAGGRLDEAEDWNERSLAIREDLGNRPGMATSFHNIGAVAQDRGHLVEAEDWYRKSMAVNEALGKRADMAVTLLRLGTVVQSAGRLIEAEDWYRKALAVNEELGNRAGMATSYHNLGAVADARGQFDDAERWSRKSLAIKEDLENGADTASAFHNLGAVAYHRGRLIEAESWFRKALAAAEGLGDRARMASSYHDLGVVAEDRGRLDEAEDSYRKWLAVNEEVGDRPAMAAGYLKLGGIAQDGGRLAEAEDWYRRLLAVNEDLGDRAGMAASYLKLGAVARHLGRLDDAHG